MTGDESGRARARAQRGGGDGVGVPEAHKIERIAQGHYQINTSGGTPIGRVHGDYAVGFQAITFDSRKLGIFQTADEAVEALGVDHARPT